MKADREQEQLDPVLIAAVGTRKDPGKQGEKQVELHDDGNKIQRTVNPRNEE